MSDREHEKEHHDSAGGERLRHAEPGIKLKVSDSGDEHLISSALSSITEPLKSKVTTDSVNAREPESLDLVETIKSEQDLADEKLQSLFERADDKSVQNDVEAKCRELKRLPTLLPVVILLFIAANGYWYAVFPISYFYWLFCNYRTSSAVHKLFSAKNLEPRRVLAMSMLPLFTLLSLIVIRVLGSPPWLFNWVPSALLLSLVVFVIYQWNWPISASIALEKAKRAASSDSSMSGWMSHALTGLLFNLVPPLLVVGLLLVGFTSSFRNGGLVSLLMFVLVLAQYIGFFVMKKRITDVALLDRDLRVYAEKSKNLMAKVSEDDIVVRYRAFAEWERWFKHRLKEKSNKKLYFLIATVVLFFAVGAPQWCLAALTQMPGVMGSGDVGSPQALSNFNFLNTFQMTILYVIGGLGCLYLLKPTHIGFSAKGIRYLWRHPILSVDGNYVKWTAFNKIRLTLPEGKTSPSDQRLLFDAGQNSGPDQNVEVKLSSIIQVDDKERILKAIERFAPGVPRDASVLQVLQPPADHSYTELWLQALSAPPKRERFKPLAEKASLLEGRYQIIGQLGVGGQGTAYLASDTHENASVVLKEFILPVYVDVAVRRQALERFENEARILKHLDHDQIVKLIDFFVEDHRSYLVLEHIEGKSLKQIVEEQGPLPENKVLELAKQMCTMLEYLHGLEPPVVHRDFTPDNLILRNDGKLKLVDFNVAQQTDSTATGTVVGKHAYLPPEQFRGAPVPQSDLYSMGATLHFLLTGQDPEPISVSHPKRVNQNVSDNMDLFVSRATAMSLEARHQDVQDLKNEIDDFFGSGT